MGDRDADLARAASPILRRLPVTFPMMLALAIVGLGIIVTESRRASTSTSTEGSVVTRRFEDAALLALVGGIYAASFFLFFFNARYRVPVAAILIVMAGVALSWCVGAVRDRSWRRLTAAIVPAAALAAVASIDVVGVPPSLDEWHYQRGTAYRDAGHPPEAIHEYEEALRVRPRSPAVRNDLALVLRDQGRRAEALAQWEAALSDAPAWFEARFNRAQVLAAEGRFFEAIPDYQRVLVDEPSHAPAHLSLGTALIATGSIASGLAHYRDAERLAPNDPLVAFVIGRALLAHGDADEGREELRRALRLDPQFEPARRALAASEAPGRGATAR
jgi:Flp pilus assembly protein TadD